ncbi:MAG: sel1 repeat family protein [Campylobacterales bacterium]|nr:sel1 repeat family protein [Campylobacterales bacterium]
MKWWSLWIALTLSADEPRYLQALNAYYDQNRQNDAAAISALTQEAEEANNADAAFLIALSYEQGSHTERNETKSLEWYEKAAELGDVDAMMMSGWRHYKGEGCTPSLEHARRWFEQAEALGEKEASALLRLLKEDRLF